MIPRAGSVLDLVAALSEAVDLVSPMVADHHRRTAWFAVRLAEEMGMASTGIRSILLAALLHDIGSFSLGERLDTLHFEFADPERHARLGFNLLDGFDPLQTEANIIRHHHKWWRPPEKRAHPREPVPTGSRILHLADRVAILLVDGVDLLNLSAGVVATVSARSGSMFMPDAIDALQRLAPLDEVWLGAFSPDLAEHLFLEVGPGNHGIRPEDLEGMARVFARIIDYRSHYTATHSAGVATVAEALAGYLGFSEENRRTIRVAGYLHDLGKLAVPSEILEKPGRLDASEYRRVKDHALHTRRLLEKVPDLGYGIKWAAQHHERMDGSGYPEHSEGREVAFGSRVVAMADILTAVTEDRPYRPGMSRDSALGVLAGLTLAGHLDTEVFRTATSHFDELNECRMAAQEAAREDYERRVAGAGGKGRIGRRGALRDSEARIH